MATLIKQAKYPLIILIIFFLSTTHCFAQKSKKNVYKVWVKKISDGKTISGYLYQISSNELIMANSQKDIIESELVSVKPEEMEILKVKRRGKGGQGALIGASIGIGVGAIIGLASSDDRDKIILPLSKGDKALIMGTTLGALGAITGALINTKKTKYVINGNSDKFKNIFEMLQSYQLKTINNP